LIFSFSLRRRFSELQLQLGALQSRVQGLEEALRRETAERKEQTERVLIGKSSKRDKAKAAYSPISALELDTKPRSKRYDSPKASPSSPQFHSPCPTPPGEEELLVLQRELRRPQKKDLISTQHVLDVIFEQHPRPKGSAQDSLTYSKSSELVAPRT
jgi:hypothetical protein